MVLAGFPVASAIRLAARPVGAARLMRLVSFSKRLIMALMMVVLPVPGPPVSTMTLFLAAMRTASAWASASLGVKDCRTSPTCLSAFLKETLRGMRCSRSR